MSPITVVLRTQPEASLGAAHLEMGKESNAELVNALGEAPVVHGRGGVGLGKFDSKRDVDLHGTTIFQDLYLFF